jgi:hypothetical protein
MGGGAAPDQHGGAPHDARGPIDVHVLADKVYALMLKEVRVGRARTESTAAPKRSLED